MSLKMKRRIAAGGGGTAAIVGSLGKRKGQSENTRSVRLVRQPRAMRSMNGTYTMSRMVNMFIQWQQNGFYVGGTTYEGIGIIYSPTQVGIYTNNLGTNTIIQSIHNAAELSGLWDEVMIDKVEMTLSSRTNDPTNTTTANSCPVLLIANDPLSATSPQSTAAYLNQLKSTTSWHATSKNESFKWTCRPQFQRQVYLSAGTPPIVSYEPGRGYIASGANVPHYGTRISFVPSAGTGYGGMNLVFNIIFKCRNVK